jgi:hypothetical protein
MVSVLASGAVDRGFEPQSGQTKHYKIGKCTALRRKSKDYLARNGSYTLTYIFTFFYNNLSPFQKINQIIMFCVIRKK